MTLHKKLNNSYEIIKRVMIFFFGAPEIINYSKIGKIHSLFFGDPNWHIYIGIKEPQ